jgi:uncharacterized BrkB/YihY/UPF0761 family membrane protein
MKKTIFSLIVALLLFTLTMLVFFIPDHILYQIKQPASKLKWWAEIWGLSIVIILGYCTTKYYYKLGEKLFDYLKED